MIWKQELIKFGKLQFSMTYGDGKKFKKYLFYKEVDGNNLEWSIKIM